MLNVDPTEGDVIPDEMSVLVVLAADTRVAVNNVGIDSVMAAH